MIILLFFVIAAVTIVAMILKFHKKQAVKVNTVLRETRAVPPLLLLKSTEQKIRILKTALRFDEAPINRKAATSIANVYNDDAENNRQLKVQELKLLSAKYNDGQMSLDSYNEKLDELLDQLQSGNGSEFVLAS